MFKKIKTYFEARRANKIAAEVQRIIDALSGRVIEEVQEVVREELHDMNIVDYLDYSEVAYHLDNSEIAEYVEVCAYDVAREMDTYDIAQEIDIDYDEIAAQFCVSDIATCFEASDIACHIDESEIAQECVSIAENSLENYLSQDSWKQDVEDSMLGTLENMVAEMRDSVMDDTINEIADRLNGIGEDE